MVFNSISRVQNLAQLQFFCVKIYFNSLQWCPIGQDKRNSPTCCPGRICWGPGSSGPRIWWDSHNCWSRQRAGDTRKPRPAPDNEVRVDQLMRARCKMYLWHVISSSIYIIHWPPGKSYKLAKIKFNTKGRFC